MPINIWFFRFVFIQLIVFSLSACGGGHAVRTSAVSEFESQGKTDRLNEVIILSSADQKGSLPESYLIGHEDLLDIEAYNVEELKKTVRVNSKGEIALPLTGILKVKGLTTSQVEQIITKKLERYIEETVVTVYVKEYKSQRISVIGAVNHPQIFAVTGQRYLIDMLMMAGGLSPDAGNISYVIRPASKDRQDSQTGTIVIDLGELLTKGNLALNIPVYAGDVVNVPKGGIIFVDGAVNLPGAYPLKGRGVSLVQAISMARGLDPVADLDEVRIFRDNGTGEREIIIADYGKMIDGETPDILIAENDVIIVPKDGVKNFFRGFVKTVRGGLNFGSGSYMGF
jgi:polysaccharide export outer membrane protein